MDYNSYLDSIDDSHQMTTDKDHIRIICDIITQKKLNILELGSHIGISTAALALSSPESNIVSVDLSDTIREIDRVSYWDSLGISNIRPITCSSEQYLINMPTFYDLIFHDAMHGPSIMPEYLMCAQKTNILVIHDFEQLTNEQQNQLSSMFHKVEKFKDIRGRILFIGFKQ